MGIRPAAAALPESLLRDLRDPLFRNGHALVLGSVLTSVIGVAYWILAARGYSPATVGRNSVAISVLTFLGTTAQLNLHSALARFVPITGRQTARLTAALYAISVSVAVLLSLGFLLLLPHVAPQLRFLVVNPWLALWFVVSTAAWGIMVMEDGVLTGLRKAHWVPVENGGFSLLKAGMVLPLAVLLPVSGIVVSWTVATFVTVALTSLYLFAKAIPAHHRADPEAPGVTTAQLLRFVPYDCLGQLLWIALSTLTPLYIIAVAGPAASAYFNLDWVIASSLCLVSIGIGTSLVVETASDQSQLAQRCREVIVHLLKLLVPVVAVIVLFAPQILRIFGPSYAAEGATTLRLLALSTLPFTVTATATNAARARQRTKAVVVVFATLFALVVSLTVLLVPSQGIAGVGMAWLAGHLVVAAALLAKRGAWLPAGRRPGLGGGAGDPADPPATREEAHVDTTSA